MSDTIDTRDTKENKENKEKKENILNNELKIGGICCFCKQECNPLSQSCGYCNRRYVFAKDKPSFWWENNEQ